MILYASIMKMEDPKKDKEVLEDHIAYLEKHIEKGNIYAKGPFLDHSGGLVIFSVDSIEDAREIVEADPAIAVGSRSYELKEWRSSLEE